MSVKSLCIGDRVRRVRLTNGQMGRTPTVVESDPMECRLDVTSDGENRDSGIADRKISAQAYFSSDPKLNVGDYLRWVQRGQNITVDPPVIFRVVGGDDDYAPGRNPILWWYDLEQAFDVHIPLPAPTYDIAEGAVAAGTYVSITCDSPGVVIRYTTDGSDPSWSSTVYGSAIQINATTTLKAKAFKVGYKDSPIAEAAYTVAP